MLFHLTTGKKENKEEKSARGDKFLTGTLFSYLLDKNQQAFFVVLVKLKHTLLLPKIR